MADHGEIPYRISFGEGVEPIDAAFLRIAQIPTTTLNELTGSTYPVDDCSEVMSLDFTIADGTIASAVMAHHNETLAANLTHFAERMKRNFIIGGASEEQAKIRADILCIGILIGRKEAQIIEEYATQGIRELESPEE